jgi:hypothetical protein
MLIQALMFVLPPKLTTTDAVKPNALQRLAALQLPKVEGVLPTYHSNGANEEAKHMAKVLTDYVDWLQFQTHVSLPITLAVLTKEDWNRIGGLPTPYPMTQAILDETLIVLPDKVSGVPGMYVVADPSKVAHLLQVVLTC